jgi:hypothetical protein
VPWDWCLLPQLKVLILGRYCLLPDLDERTEICTIEKLRYGIGTEILVNSLRTHLVLQTFFRHCPYLTEVYLDLCDVEYDSDEEAHLRTLQP